MYEGRCVKNVYIKGCKMWPECSGGKAAWRRGYKTKDYGYGHYERNVDLCQEGCAPWGPCRSKGQGIRAFPEERGCADHRGAIRLLGRDRL